jgi:hypothetical protein
MDDFHGDYYLIGFLGQFFAFQTAQAASKI